MKKEVNQHAARLKQPAQEKGRQPATLLRRTGSSNPFPSSGESQQTFGSARDFHEKDADALVRGDLRGSAIAASEGLRRSKGAVGGSPVYCCVGACLSGFGGAGGSFGETWVSGGLHGLRTISVLISRSLLHASSVSSQS